MTRKEPDGQQVDNINVEMRWQHALAQWALLPLLPFASKMQNCSKATGGTIPVFHGVSMNSLKYR
jgi:hypothetical protein